MIRLAEARRAASTMIRCSIRASLMDMSPAWQWVWMMKASDPRRDSENRQWSSPFEKSARFGSPSDSPSSAAIDSASGRLIRPATRYNFLWVTSSMRGVGALVGGGSSGSGA